eukprot:scaffold19795_cov62-Skeletonema_dohrnii-CCMP3373.AAC.2
MIYTNTASDKEEAPPPGWVSCFSKSAKRPYYLHVATKHSQWEYPSQTEVKNPTLAKKRRDNAEAEKQRAEALRQEEAKVLRQKKELMEDEKERQLQLQYQIAIQKRNEEAILSAIPASTGYQSVDGNYIKIYADGLHGLDDGTITKLLTISGNAMRSCLEGRVGGTALFVMTRESGEKAIRHLHKRQIKGGRTLTVKKAFNQDISNDIRMQLSEDYDAGNGTNRGPVSSRRWVSSRLDRSILSYTCRRQVWRSSTLDN